MESTQLLLSKGGVHPEQVTSPLQGLSLTYTPGGNLEPQINPKKQGFGLWKEARVPWENPSIDRGALSQ